MVYLMVFGFIAAILYKIYGKDSEYNIYGGFIFPCYIAFCLITLVFGYMYKLENEAVYEKIMRGSYHYNSTNTIINERVSCNSFVFRMFCSEKIAAIKIKGD